VTTWAAWAAAALSLGGYIPYLHGVLFGRTSPSVMAWMIWSAEYAVLFAALVWQDPGPALWLPGAQLAGTFITFICALVMHRDPGLDWRRAGPPLAFCFAALVAWANFRSPVVVVLIILAVEGYGMRITIARAWRWPQTETSWAWVMWAWAGVAGLFAAGWSAPWGAYIYPVYFTVMGSAVVIAFSTGSRRLAGPLLTGTRRAHRTRPGHPA